MANKLKWVEVRSGRYKLVEPDDPRPEVKLQDRWGSPNVAFTPSWKKYETPMFIGDLKSKEEAVDKFSQEREHAIKVDPKAARWEKSRREWFQKQKHNWRNNEIQKLKEQGL
jgi:hypothetical protein